MIKFINLIHLVQWYKIIALQLTARQFFSTFEICSYVHYWCNQTPVVVVGTIISY